MYLPVSVWLVMTFLSLHLFVDSTPLESVLCHRGHVTIRVLRPMETEKRMPGNEVDRVAGVLRPLYSLFLKPIKMDPATDPSTVWSLISPRLRSKERSETQDCRCACVEHEKNA